MSNMLSDKLLEEIGDRAIEIVNLHALNMHGVARLDEASAIYDDIIAAHKQNRAMMIIVKRCPAGVGFIHQMTNKFVVVE